MPAVKRALHFLISAIDVVGTANHVTTTAKKAAKVDVISDSYNLFDSVVNFE
jgi:hypothetical protein